MNIEGHSVLFIIAITRTIKLQQAARSACHVTLSPSSALLLSRGWSLQRSQQVHRWMYLSQMEEFLSWQLLIKTCHLQFCSLREGLWAETVKFLLSLPHGLCLGTNEELGEGSDCSSAIETKESEFHYSKSPGDWMSSEALKKKEVKC